MIILEKIGNCNSFPFFRKQSPETILYEKTVEKKMLYAIIEGRHRRITS